MQEVLTGHSVMHTKWCLQAKVDGCIITWNAGLSLEEASLIPEGAARSVSGSALCSKSMDESLWHLKANSLSLPEACQASPGQAGLAGAEDSKQFSGSSGSKLSDLNGPQGAVPAVPEQESKVTAINRPQGAVPPVPVEWSGLHDSSAEQARQHSSASLSSNAAQSQWQDVPARHATDQQHEASGSATACSEQEQPQHCSEGGAEEQGCAACIHQQQQQQQALQSGLELKGLDQALIAQSRLGLEPEVSFIQTVCHPMLCSVDPSQKRTAHLCCAFQGQEEGFACRVTIS